ncbi:MAG: hypothetical protein ACYS8W_08535 [Planctomycetota bacterium]|jgi:hypothetical protein
MVGKKAAQETTKNVKYLRRILDHYKGYPNPDYDKVRPAGRRSQKRGYYNREDFLAVCIWKSARPKRFYVSNSTKKIEDITRKALETNYEKLRMERLIRLKGVSVAVGSALLAVLDPQRYGVIDIRVWQTLYWLGSVKKNPAGTNLSVTNWLHYLFMLRAYAKKLKVKVRRLEICLFWFHDDYLQGDEGLYDPKRKISKKATTNFKKELAWLFK